MTTLLVHFMARVPRCYNGFLGSQKWSLKSATIAYYVETKSSERVDISDFFKLIHLGRTFKIFEKSMEFGV